jgi:signal transduction histidine kinase
VENLGTKILVVEDDPAHVAAISRSLKDADGSVTLHEAGSLREYQALVAVEPPDIVIIDLNLPDGRAVEILPFYDGTPVPPDSDLAMSWSDRTAPETGSFPVLIMTSFGNERVAVDALKAGALDYIVKSPESFAEMPRIVDRVMREWRLLMARKQAEERVRASNDELQALNRQLQENQQQLIQSEKMASIGQLAAGVAHEINNPIGFVKSNLGTLLEYVGFFKKLLVLHGQLVKPLEAAAPSACAAVLEQIRFLRQEEDLDFVMTDVDNLLAESIDGIQRVQDIILNLKSFARAGESKRVEADINEGIESTLKIVWNELKYKCRVHKNLKSLPRIRCYPGQLNQVFMNLLVNAAQSIPESGQVHISSELDGQCITVRISDTGAGIPPDVMGRIFDPFFTTKGVGKGTGLGLSISLGIIQKHGGRIEVESQVGKGTVFTIRLPVDGESSS